MALKVHPIVKRETTGNPSVTLRPHNTNRQYPSGQPLLLPKQRKASSILLTPNLPAPCNCPNDAGTMSEIVNGMNQSVLESRPADQVDRGPVELSQWQYFINTYEYGWSHRGTSHVLHSFYLSRNFNCPSPVIKWLLPFHLGTNPLLRCMISKKEKFV